MSFLRQQSMVPSQDADVDIRAGHWKVSSRVQAKPFSASFQVVRLAALPEGCLPWSIIIIFDDNNAASWPFGRRGGTPSKVSKRPFIFQTPGSRWTRVAKSEDRRARPECSNPPSGAWAPPKRLGSHQSGNYGRMAVPFAFGLASIIVALKLRRMVAQ
ncbi:hypothetical protein V8E51_004470 [Hyaloscypha variabilis]|jgi:hypothetical protein